MHLFYLSINKRKSEVTLKLIILNIQTCLIIFYEQSQFILSTSVDGKIKTWFYDRPRSEISYEAPGNGCTTMAYSVDGSRYCLIFDVLVGIYMGRFECRIKISVQ